MTKRRKSKHNSQSHHDSVLTTSSSNSYGGGNRFAAFDFIDDGVEQESQRKLSKYSKTSPKKRSRCLPVDKYTFLNYFTKGSTTPRIDSGNEPIDVDDDFPDDKRHDMSESPGSMMKSLSISLNTHAASYSRGNSGIRNAEEKNKYVLEVESDDDGIVDLQTSTHLDLAEGKGSLVNVTAPRGSDVTDCEAVVVVYPLYVKVGKVHYTKCSLTFSGSSIRLEESPLHERKTPHHLDWSTFDIVKIEHRPCKSVKANILNFHLRANDTNLDETCNGNSGILDLEFVVDENQWYKKHQEIKLLHLKYEAAWETIISEPGSTELVDVNLVYPEGDPESIFISSRDVELLRPMTFLNDTIIDFYMKYLITKIKPEVQHRFHFFNTFFFRKLADMDQSTSIAWDGREAFQRVCKWTKNIDLFEKDFIFIPVNFSLHWSLIVICYPGKLPNLKDNDLVDLSVCPCILHMDSIRGSHRGLKEHIQSYLCEEWRERHGEHGADKFMSLHFDALQLPQQENLSDCGIFLLHYAELFLEHTANLSNTKYSDFLNEAWFLPAEVSLKKRDLIRKLISSLAKEQAMKGPQVATNEKYLLTPVNEGDSSVEIVNRRDVKEACDGRKYNSGIDHRIKMQQLFGVSLEPENGGYPVSDETTHQQLVPISQPSVMKMPTEIEAIEIHSTPRDIRSRSRIKADEDMKSPIPSFTSVLVGDIEVPVNTATLRAGISPVIFQIDDDEHPVNETTPTPVKMDNYCSVLSEDEYSNCIVEDSEEESGRDDFRITRHTRCISNID